jgi:hypothetical protein
MARYEFAHSHGGPLDHYYASLEWAHRRNAYLSRYGRRCEACGSTDRIDVHHADYTNLHEERDDDLVALCRNCHAECHQLQVEFGWHLPEMTRKFLDYRKAETERTALSMSNDALRRRQDALLGRQADATPVPSLELQIQEPIVVARRAQRPRWSPPPPRGTPGICIVCSGGQPGVVACGACLTPVHMRCSRLKRDPICSVECSIEWMEAFGHA